MNIKIVKGYEHPQEVMELFVELTDMLVEGMLILENILLCKILMMK